MKPIVLYVSVTSAAIVAFIVGETILRNERLAENARELQSKNLPAINTLSDPTATILIAIQIPFPLIALQRYDKFWYSQTFLRFF